MQRRTQGIVALGGSAVLGVVVGVLVVATGPDRVVTDPNPMPSQSGTTSTPLQSPANLPAAVPDAPTRTKSASPSPAPMTGRPTAATPSETDDNRGRGRGRGQNDNGGSGHDNSGSGGGEKDDSEDEG
jgi:hypothetical protein